MTATEARKPRVFEKTGTIAAGVTVGTDAVVVLGPIVGGPSTVAYVVAAPHYHLPAKHDDPIMLGTEVGLALAVLFVGWKLVACRRARSVYSNGSSPAAVEPARDGSVVPRRDGRGSKGSPDTLLSDER